MAVRPDRVAVVLRAREGSNLLVQTRGLSAKIADDASRSVASVLTDFAAQSNSSSLHKTGNQAPGYTLGDMLVDNGRYRVVYRLVNMVYAMVVAPAAANVFFALQLLEPITRLLIAASRSVEVTPDKLTKRYSELYLGLASMAAGIDANAGRVLADAETAVQSIAPDAVKPKNMAAKLRDLSTIPRLKSFGSSAAASREPSNTAPSTTSNHRVLEEETNPMEGISFALPPDAFAPQPVASPDPKYRGGAVPDALPGAAAAGRRSRTGVESLDEMLQASRPQQGGDAGLAGTGLEALSGLGGDGQDQYAAPGSPTSFPVQQLAAPTVLTNPPPAPAGMSDDNFFEAFTGGKGALPAQQDGGLSSGNYMQEPPRPQTRAWTPAVSAEDPEVDVAAQRSSTTALRGPDAEDVLAIMQGRALRLRETWRAAFVGDQLTTAGIAGEVVGTGQVRPSKTTAWFRLSVPLEGAHILLRVLRCCQLLKANTEKEPLQKGSFKAVVGRAPAGEAPFLRYRLPASFCAPPLLLRLSLLFGQPQQAQQHGSISFMMQWAVSPALPGPLTGITLDLHADAALGPPIKVAPRAVWAKATQCLRWQLPAAAPGSQGVAKVAFQPPASQTSSTLAAAGILGGPTVAAAYAAKATLQFFGPQGRSISGMSMQSGVDLTHMLPGDDMFQGVVTAQPSR